MNDNSRGNLPHGLTIDDLNAELDDLDSNLQVGPDITYDEYVRLVRYMLRRRRRSGGAGLVSSIIITPAVLSVLAGSPIGTPIGTLSVINGLGAYSFSFISNPGNYFTIVGNQIQVGATLPSPQTITVQIQGDNGVGDRPVLTTTITIVASLFVPTYHIYGF